jgi:predicted ATPase/class 3 adenylate cyclase
MQVQSYTLTFLCTDIEGSTKLWESAPEAMQTALALHNALLQNVIAEHGGHLFKMMGDGGFAAFASATDAVHAALDFLKALRTQEWPPETGPLRVRVALHSGTAMQQAEDYLGPPLNKTSRLVEVAHGGQLILSEATKILVEVHLPPNADLLDLGWHRLRDLKAPEHIYQLIHPELERDFPPLRSLAGGFYPNNLPFQLSSFIGREREVEEIRNLLESGRLVSLVGVGGCGKSRLSLQVAAEMLEHFPDGVWWVELASVQEGNGVASQIGSVLGLRETPTEPMEEVLLRYLRNKALLLVLDNCEHLLEAVGRLVSRILRECGETKILTSSRERLHVMGERVYPVLPLSLPSSNESLSVAEVAHYEALALFVERAQNVLPEFRVDNENLEALVEVCHKLDGIPLALELAASRLRVISLPELAYRLDERLRILRGGMRSELSRHRTLRATLDWSYELLTPREQELFCSLGAFRGGWSLEAIEHVGEEAYGLEAWEVLELLEGLVEKSLCMMRQRKGEVRYNLLETVREYAVEKLRERGPEFEGRVRRAHAHYYTNLADVARTELLGKEGVYWAERLTEEWANIEETYAWYRRQHDWEACLRLCVALSDFWLLNGSLREGLTWCETALANYSAEDYLYGKGLVLVTHLRYRLGDLEQSQAYAERLWKLAEHLHHEELLGFAHRFKGYFAFLRKDYSAAEAHFKSAYSYFRSVGDRIKEAIMLAELFTIPYNLGDFERAQEYIEQAIALHREVGDEISLSYDLFCLGQVLLQQQSQFERARSLFEEALAIARTHGNVGNLPLYLNALAHVYQEQGEYAKALALEEEALAICRNTGERWKEASTLAQLGRLAYYQGEYEKARHYFEEVLQLYPTPDNIPALHHIQAANFGLATLALRERNYEQAYQRFQQLVEWGRQYHLPLAISAPLRKLSLLALLHHQEKTARDCLDEALAVAREHEDVDEIAYTLRAYGVYRAWQAQHEGYSQAQRVTFALWAARLLGGAHRILEDTQVKVSPYELTEQGEGWLAQARALIGEDRFEAAYNEGHAWSMEQTITAALAEPRP